MQTAGARATFSGATKVAVGNGFELWKPLPSSVPRLSTLVGGYDASVWLSWQSFVSACGFEVWLPRDATATTLTIRGPGARESVALAPDGVHHVVTVPASHAGRWTAHLSAPHAVYVGLHPVSAMASAPVFRRVPPGGRAARDLVV